MSSIFPLREAVSLGEDRDPRLVELDDDVADEVFDALSSRTTRQIFAHLHESPQAASDLADVTDTSVQNAQYHLEKLVAADLVEVVDTWYSERGTEMNVYAPTDEALVLFAGQDKEGTLRALLKRLVGALAVLLPASLAVAWLTDQLAGGSGERFTVASGGDSGAGVGAGTDEEPSQPESVDGNDHAETNVATEVTDGLESDDAGSGDGGDGGGGGGGDGSGPDATTVDGQSSTADNITTRSNETNGTDGEPTIDPDSTPTPESSVDTGTATGEVTPTPDPTDSVTEVSVDATPTPDPQLADVAVSTVGGIDPALLAGTAFFCGGLFVLAMVGMAWYVRD